MFTILRNRAGVIHSLEATFAMTYYAWGAFYFGLYVSTEVKGLRADITYELASKQALLSCIQCTMTKIKDGQRVHVSGMGFLTMVCQLHTKEEEEEEEEDDEEEEEEDDEEELFTVGRATLDMLWQPQELVKSMPWIGSRGVEHGVTRATAYTEYTMCECARSCFVQLLL